MVTDVTPLHLGEWRLDDKGYLRWRETGTIALRVDGNGRLWFWDRRARKERPLTLEALERFCYWWKTLTE